MDPSHLDLKYLQLSDSIFSHAPKSTTENKPSKTNSQVEVLLSKTEREAQNIFKNITKYIN